MYFFTVGLQKNKKFVKGRQEKHLPLHSRIENSESIDKGRGLKVPTSAPSYLSHRTIDKKVRVEKFLLSCFQNIEEL